MSGLQARLDTVFGDLNRGNVSTPPWRPVQEHVFKLGSDLDLEMSSDGDEEYRERTRREVILGTELANEDAPDEEGFMPSTAFCSQLDREQDSDLADAIAMSPMEDVRPDRHTEVLNNNVYEHQLAFLDEEISRMEEDVGPVSHPLGRHAIAASPSFKSNLRKSPRSEGALKKRVSFTGIPDPPTAWVPPHKRADFVSKFGNNFMPPTGPAPESLKGVRLVPDHVVNPKRYTRYTLEHPIVIGGGLAQLREVDDANEGELELVGQEDIVLATATTSPGFLERAENGNGVAEQPQEEVERWQGAVGGGIDSRFTRQQQGGASAEPDVDLDVEGHEVDNEGRKGGTGVSTIAASFEWEDEGNGIDEDYVMDENGGKQENGNGSGSVKTRKERKQYRRGGENLSEDG